jgi:hypothetical protein
VRGTRSICNLSKTSAYISFHTQIPPLHSKGTLIRDNHEYINNEMLTNKFQGISPVIKTGSVAAAK